jgi:hypothetical protein
MKEQKVATEMAEQEFERFAEAMDLDLDPKGMDDEDKKSFEQFRRRVVAALESGHVEVNENGEPVVHPRTTEDKTPIVFREPTGATIMAMDQKRKDHDVAKQMAMLAAMTGRNPGFFATMGNRDLKLCNAILLLFLG